MFQHALQAHVSTRTTLIIEIYDKIVTPGFDSLAIRQSPYTKDTSSQHRYAPGFKG